MKEIKKPYGEYKDTKLWELINNIINDLQKNQDIELTTKKEYIVGYFCKILEKHSFTETQSKKTK